MEIKDFLVKMNAVPHVSGYEGGLARVIAGEFSKYAEVSADKFGNLIARKPGPGPKVMVSAHMDEIGMMASVVCDGGFVKFSRVGGIDGRNMLAQEVTIHGRRPVFGVIGIKPPHLTSEKERSKAVELHEMAIDTGYSREKLEELVKPGDIITFNRSVAELQNGKLTGKALDNIAGVAAMHRALKNLEHFSHRADLYFVASAQEEVGLRGAKTATYSIKPDIGIAVDVTFGRAGGVAEYESFELGKGPAIAVGPNITRKMFEDLKKTAVKNNIKYQIEVAPASTGTDAYAIQIGENGVLTGLLSIPLRYMHSTVETVAVCDIESCGRLISEYIISLQEEGQPCC